MHSASLISHAAGTMYMRRACLIHVAIATWDMHMGAARSSLYEYAVPSACTCRRTSMAVGCLPGSSLEESVGIRRKVVGRLWDAELTLWSTIRNYPLAASQPVSPRSSWLSCPLTRNPPDGGRVWGFGQTLFQLTPDQPEKDLFRACSDFSGRLSFLRC
jgi:hypothetical protein